ncbi:uncharacterized protein LOC113286268 [Papaver somniferum]|uniref:uncharacterized protein LOC113286268 n=1 Tax=Papaver somniferum TaxID=3469 RepID=UPI000E6FF669|nr:uncharacterized protein LOC113286268 [Papaver somniferum]
MNLTQVGSDHSPIMLASDTTTPKSWKPFKFFLTWLNDESCTSVIENAWRLYVSGSPGFQLAKRFQSTKKELSLWNRTHFVNVNKRVDDVQKELDVLQEQPPYDENHNKILDINKDLSKWQKYTTDFYQQKSRDHFIKDMDNNNKYFHNKTNKRRMKNNIDSLQDQNNTWLHTREEISQHLTSHFKEISTSIVVTLDEGHFMLISTIITDADNLSLTRVPSHHEIHDTLKSMENWSAPGLEGFQAGFHKSQWSIIGEDVCQMITRFF